MTTLRLKIQTTTKRLNCSRNELPPWRLTWQAVAPACARALVPANLIRKEILTLGLRRIQPVMQLRAQEIFAPGTHALPGVAMQIANWEIPQLMNTRHRLLSAHSETCN